MTGPGAEHARGRVEPGCLYVVATPLGNLEDITLRALRILRGVDWIAAEDTRHTRKLLQHYSIAARLTSYHDWIEREKAPRLVEALCAGKSVALVSDAGTPGIRDPGFHLVRAAIAAGVRVVPVPGPSAVVAALSASGLPAHRFAFEGFVPARATQRRKWLQSLRDEPRTWVCFEAARRLSATLADIAATLGQRQVVVARELTKVHEEFLRGNAAELVRALEARQEPLRGEVTLLVEGASASPSPGTEPLWQVEMEAALARGLSVRDAARLVAERHPISRREAYQFGLARIASRDAGD